MGIGFSRMPVKVEPGLADGNDIGIGGEFLDVGNCRVVETIGVVRVAADRREQALEFSAEGDLFTIRGLVQTDRENLLHAGLAGGPDHLFRRVGAARDMGV